MLHHRMSRRKWRAQCCLQRTKLRRRLSVLHGLWVHADSTQSRDGQERWNVRRRNNATTGPSSHVSIRSANSTRRGISSTLSQSISQSSSLPQRTSWIPQPSSISRPSSRISSVWCSSATSLWPTISPLWLNRIDGQTLISVRPEICWRDIYLLFENRVPFVGRICSFHLIGRVQTLTQLKVCRGQTYTCCRVDPWPRAHHRIGSLDSGWARCGLSDQDLSSYNDCEGVGLYQGMLFKCNMILRFWGRPELHLIRKESRNHPNFVATGEFIAVWR